MFPRSPCSSHTARGPREQEVASPHRALKGPPMSVQFSEMKGLNAFCSLRSRTATRSVSFRCLLWRSVPAGVNQGAAAAPPKPHPWVQLSPRPGPRAEPVTEALDRALGGQHTGPGALNGRGAHRQARRRPVPPVLPKATRPLGRPGSSQRWRRCLHCRP